jgi:hypothetical protein
MPLPWLIGAAVVGLGSALVAALKSDDEPSSTISTAETARRAHEAAAEQRRKAERKQKKDNARTLFAEAGAVMGSSLEDALHGIVDVMSLGEPAFTATLTTQGYRLPPVDTSRAHEVEHALAEVQRMHDPVIARISEQLIFYTAVYDVHLQGSSTLYRKIMDIQAADKELATLDQIAQQLRALQTELGATL